MSDSQNMSDEVRARLRAIPSVNELLTEYYFCSLDYMRSPARVR